MGKDSGHKVLIRRHRQADVMVEAVKVGEGDGRNLGGKTALLRAITILLLLLLVVVVVVVVGAGRPSVEEPVPAGLWGDL